MDNEHDYFNDFFNIHKDKEKMKEAARKMIEVMKNLERVEKIEKHLDDNLGEPDKTEGFTDGILMFERRIWFTPEGEIIKVVVTDTASTYEKPLSQQLSDALEIEDYERAVIIRDKINLIIKSL